MQIKIKKTIVNILNKKRESDALKKRKGKKLVQKTIQK